MKIINTSVALLVVALLCPINSNALDLLQQPLEQELRLQELRAGTAADSNQIENVDTGATTTRAPETAGNDNVDSQKNAQQMKLLEILGDKIAELQEMLGKGGQAVQALADLEQQIYKDNVAVEPEDFAYMLVDLGVLDSADDVEPWLEHNFQTITTSADGQLYYGETSNIDQVESVDDTIFSQGNTGDSEFTYTDWWSEPQNQENVQLEWVDESTTSMTFGDNDMEPIEMTWTYEEEWPEWFDESALEFMDYI